MGCEESQRRGHWQQKPQAAISNRNINICSYHCQIFHKTFEIKQSDVQVQLLPYHWWNSSECRWPAFCLASSSDHRPTASWQAPGFTRKTQRLSEIMALHCRGLLRKQAILSPECIRLSLAEVFFLPLKTGTFLGLLGGFERTHLLVPLCYHPLCKWHVLTPAHPFPATSFPKIAINQKKENTRVVGEGIGVPIATIHSILEARIELMRLCISLFQHLVVSRSDGKASDSTATQPEGRDSGCPPFPYPCKKERGKKDAEKPNKEK